MSWIDHAIWWHVYPLGFTGAPIGPGDQGPQRGLRHLIDWLDYVVELGTSGLALGPIFSSATHGYDTIDHWRIDPRLGTEDDFDALVDACHQRGLRILLDGVFNHVGRDSWLVERPGLCTGEVFEGHHDLPELDHTNPEVASYVAEVMTHWLGRGADGWRLDAAYAVDPRFWSDVVARVRRSHPQAWFVGEVIHGDYPAFVAESGLDSVTQYELWKAIWSSVRDCNFYELAHALERHNGFLNEFRPLTFVGNHDVNRIASTLGDGGAALAAVVLFTVGGIPAVYYGDEQAYRGRKFERVGGDDEVRPVFPAEPQELSQLGSWMFDVYRQLISIRRRYPWLTSSRCVVMELDNERLVYRAGEDAEHLVVELDIGGGASATISCGEQALFTLAGSA